MALLSVTDLDVFYGSAQVLWNVGLEVASGEIVALIGANGAGKTTLMKTIAGIVDKKTGSINYNGENILHMQSHEIVQKGISLVPEGRHLFTGMTVEENIKMGAYLRRDKAGIKASLEMIYSMFPRLAGRKKQLAGKMSGGEQQMCAIARAMMADPKLLMIDELSLGLAPIFIDELLVILQQLNQQGVTIFLVEQDVQTGLEISNRAYVLEHGRIVKSGASSALLKDEGIRESYLGI